MWKLAASRKTGRQRRYCSQIQYSLLVLLVPMIIFLLGAGALTTQAHTNSPQFQKQQTALISQQEAYALGETFKIGNLQYRINGIRTSDGNGYDKSAREDNTYLFINLTIENQGSNDIEVRSMIGFKLTDLNSKSIKAISAVKDAIDGTIKAGGRMTGELGYEVLNKTQTFDLTVIPDPLSSKTAIAKVRILMQ
ncbi:DUF4352 domain-containing protein [Desulfosporosinus nitroreducens]|uniref:DUF4352 domain-containing protein n=1 Tax=Desulfosporosinus nitroreducens TaxID=2018668 RepID=A0ABT8QV78_9FIRM|nr:DUF4352 domain-containing protein [Desulfosporosinus nitroreducens]MCO1601664.1 DUF4352 domain-containing protein [Desulfosporosinus nitroreducens]MDO0825245.1 DUF4352 domain-containing protein [Desulfosporosinus nitroreducens]